MALSHRGVYLTSPKTELNHWTLASSFCFSLGVFVVYRKKSLQFCYDSALVWSLYFLSSECMLFQVVEMNLHWDQEAVFLPPCSHYHNFDSALFFSVTLMPLSASLLYLPLVCFFFSILLLLLLLLPLHLSIHLAQYSLPTFKLLPFFVCLSFTVHLNGKLCPYYIICITFLQIWKQILVTRCYKSNISLHVILNCTS